MRASTESVRVKLRNIDDVCRHLVVTGKQRLTVPSLLSTYAARHPAKDQAIAESSIRNKRAGGNPYQDLYRAWESAAEVILSTSPRSKGGSAQILTEDDLARVDDHTVRHQVKLLIARNRSYKSQLDILKKVVGQSTINLQATHPDAPLRPNARKLDLTESETSSLVDFVTSRRLQGRGLAEGDMGVLLQKGGKELSDPGFLDALRKIVGYLDEVA